jgi:hypothetical protein
MTTKRTNAALDSRRWQPRTALRDDLDVSPSLFDVSADTTDPPVSERFSATRVVRVESGPALRHIPIEIPLRSSQSGGGGRR